jgi:type VI protein secretion system component VasA
MKTKRKRISVVNKKAAEMVYSVKNKEQKEKKTGFLISISFINERRHSRAAEIADCSINQLCINTMRTQMAKLQIINGKYES